MTRSLLEDAFAHHVWATLRLIDTCQSLSPEQQASEVAGTYGSILATMRHLVGGDASYLNVLTDGRVPVIDEDQSDLSELRTAMEENGVAWASLLTQDLDPDVIIVRQRDDGSESQAPLGIRLAQAIHHGTDHRSQICTILTTLAIEPPAIDVWDFAAQNGRVVEVMPAT